MTTTKALFVLCLLPVVGCGSVEGTEAPDQPSLTKVEPDHGPTPGGGMVTLTGTKFQSSGDVLVLVGGKLATGVMVSNDTTLTFTAPPGDEGSQVDVTVTNANGFATKAQSYTYNPEPRLLSISPAYGKSVGGSTVVITGRGFQAFEAGAATVTMAGGTATSAVVVDDQHLMVTTGAAAAGTVAFTPTDVVVKNANGTSTLKGAFQVTTQGLIALEHNGAGRLYHIDLATGHVNQFGASHPRTFRGCAVNATDAKLYCVVRAGHNGRTAQSLVTWDPLTNVVTNIGPLNDTGAVNHPVNTLTFIGNTAYGVNTPFVNGVATPSGLLETINVTSGAVTTIGTTAPGVAREHGLALKDGATLWVAGTSNTTLDTIAIATGARTAGPTLSGGSNSRVRGLITVGSTLYLSDEAANSGIYTVNTTTGVLTKFATLPINSFSVFQTPPSF